MAEKKKRKTPVRKRKVPLAGQPKIKNAEIEREPPDPEAVRLASLEYSLDETDRKMLKLLVQFPDITNYSLGALCNIGHEGARARRRKPAFKAAFADLFQKTSDLLARAARDGTRRLIQLVNHDDPEIALKAIKMALAPYTNQVQANVNINTSKTFSTTVSPDGNLIQKVIEAEITSDDKEKSK